MRVERSKHEDRLLEEYTSLDRPSVTETIICESWVNEEFMCLVEQAVAIDRGLA